MLGLEEVKIIENQVTEANIHYSHLRDDLIDHICCDVEHMMKDGYKFSDAYEKVRERIGYRGLKKIQDDTFYLIDKTYRTMKKLMKTTGLIAPALLGIGSLFKIFHWPGAGILLVLGFFVLCFLFLPTSIYILYKETKSKKNVFTYLSGFMAALLYSLGVLFKVMHFPFGTELLFAGIFTSALLFLPALFITKLKGASKSTEKSAIAIGMVALIILLIGFVFKIMHWPGASALLFFGNVFVFVIAIPFYGISLMKNKKQISGQFIFLIIASSWLVISMNLISVKTSRTLGKNYYNLYESLSKNNSDLLTSNTTFYNTDTLANTKEIHKATTEIIESIEAIKKTLLRMDNQQNPYLEDISIKSIEFLKHPFDRELVFKSMIGEKNDGIAFDLQNKLKAYTNTIGKYTQSASGSDLLNTLATEFKSSDWPTAKFNRTLFHSINYLSMVQQKILLFESNAQMESKIMAKNSIKKPQNQNS